MHNSPPPGWENRRDSCVESRGKKRRNSTATVETRRAWAWCLKIYRSTLCGGETQGEDELVEAACTGEVKLNGRRRELPGNWKLGCGRRTARHEPLSPRHVRGRRQPAMKPKDQARRREGSNINSRYFAWRGRNIRSIVRLSIPPLPFPFSFFVLLDIFFSRFPASFGPSCFYTSLLVGYGEQ